MKKTIFTFICAVLFLYTLPAAVLAIPNSTSTGSTTTTTTTGSTATTAVSDPEFTIRYINDYNGLEVTWNVGDFAGVTVDSVKIGDKIKGVFDNSGSFTVDISDLHPGLYTADFLLNNGKHVFSAQKIERAGELETNIKLTENNVRLEASVLDNYGRPVAGCEVNYRILTTTVETMVTDENGVVKFTTPLPVDKDTVFCWIKDDTVELPITGQTLFYKGAEGGFSDTPPSTTRPSTSASSSSSTTTSSSGRPITTRSYTTAPTSAVPTLPVITGAGTTAIAGDKIAINVSFDTGVPKGFGYSADFISSRARLLIDKNVYANAIGNSTASMMLLARTSPFDITDQHISAYISNKSKFSLFRAEETKRVPLDLSMLIVDRSNDVNTTVNMPETEVTIEMPVPKSMKDSSRFMIAAALFDNNGIVAVLNTTVKDGIIQFKTSKLSSVVILGFQNPNGGSKGNDIPFIALVMILFGILMLGGAGALLYFFFIRRPAVQTDKTDQTGTEGFKIVDPDTPYNLPVKNQTDDTNADTDDHSPAQGVSLGSLLNRSEKDDGKKNK